jgi:hypothetical protein
MNADACDVEPTTPAAAITTVQGALMQIATLDWRSPETFNTVREEATSPLGYFEGLPPHVALLDDGRKARLLSELTFVHDNWDPWPVPPGTEVDGASIPRPFWTLIGGPFEGRYRNASIVHDHYCDSKARPWRDVHRMFHEAMLAGGVSNAKAKIMYYAVYRFGPRWTLPGATTESAFLPASASEVTDDLAEGVLRDAEAIYTHDLSLEEIEALAEIRNIEPPAAFSLDELEAGFGARDSAALGRARQLVVIGGSGTSQDHEAVAQQAALLPSYLMARFERTGVRLVACRNSVTDFETDLRNQVPRGWETIGKTWDDVPGAFFPDRKRVVVATIVSGHQRVVPEKSSGLHGSADLVVHESLHGYDYIGGHAVLREQRYLNARTADLAGLSAYEKQSGQAGLEETFAESGAYYAVAPHEMQGVLPNLHGYWETGPLDGETITGVPLESTELSDAPIGVARITDSGSIEIDLRAEGAGGAIGHAWFEVSPADPSHAELRSKFFGDAEGLESAPGSEVLIRP